MQINTGKTRGLLRLPLHSINSHCNTGKNNKPTHYLVNLVYILHITVWEKLSKQSLSITKSKQYYTGGPQH